jgi:hypothetical protein
MWKSLDSFEQAFVAPEKATAVLTQPKKTPGVKKDGDTLTHN